MLDSRSWIISERNLKSRFQKYFLSIIAAAFSASLFLGPATFAAQEQSTRGKIDALASRSPKNGAWLDISDKLVEISGHAAVSEADKGYALLRCMRMLGKLTKERPSEKGIEVFKRYRENFWGLNSDYDAEAVQLHVQFHRRLLRTQPDKLEDALKAVDMVAEVNKTKNKSFNHQGRDLFRAEMYCTAGKNQEAAELMKVYFSTYKYIQPEAYRVSAQASSALGKKIEALNTIAEGVSTFGESAKDQQYEQVLPLFRKMVASADVTSEDLDALISKLSSNRTGMQILFSAMAQKEYAKGNYDGALAYARIDYSVAPLSKLEGAIETIGKCLLATTGNPDATNDFMALQIYGPAGRDGIPENDDDLKNPLEGMASPLSAATMANLESRLKELPDAQTIYSTLKEHGTLCLLLGRHREALAAYKSAYAAARVEEMHDAGQLLPCALKALDGNPVRANMRMAFQEKGPAGDDGLIGTADDLDDPLAKEDLPPLPQDLQQSLRMMANGADNTYWNLEIRAFALRALGSTKEALIQAQLALAQAPNAKTIERGIKAVAASIKAHDGHVTRANQYLQFKKYGLTGADGKLGTIDDLADPLPDILKEIQKL